MGFNLQLLFTGIGIGSIYALVALGFALIYRATNVVNFAQGDFAMLGAFAMVVLAIDLELPYWLSILITLALLVGFGALFNLAVYYPLSNRGFLPVIIITIGALIYLEYCVLAAYGPRPESRQHVRCAGLQYRRCIFDSQYLVILVVSMVMVALQYVFFERTLIERRCRRLSGQGDGEPARHSSDADDYAHLQVQRHAGRVCRHTCRAGAVRYRRMGSWIALKASQLHRWASATSPAPSLAGLRSA
jgi:branched-subunit amino acid ABC-type transport system permease component